VNIPVIHEKTKGIILCRTVKFILQNINFGRTEQYLNTIAPGKMKARHTAEVDPMN
jgi:hypothetical protein